MSGMQLYISSKVSDLFAVGLVSTAKLCLLLISSLIRSVGFTPPPAHFVPNKKPLPEGRG